MTDLEAFEQLVPLDNGLVVVSTTRANGTVQSSVVNAGVLDHPISGRRVVGFVAAGTSKRLGNLRAPRPCHRSHPGRLAVGRCGGAGRSRRT